MSICSCSCLQVAVVDCSDVLTAPCADSQLFALSLPGPNHDHTLQVMMTLGKALEIEADAAQRSSYWLVLSKQRSTDLVNGELCLGFEMMYMDPQQHSQVSLAASTAQYSVGYHNRWYISDIYRVCLPSPARCGTGNSQQQPLAPVSDKAIPPPYHLAVLDMPTLHEKPTSRILQLCRANNCNCTCCCLLQLTADLEDQLSSESLASHLTSKALHIQLKGLNGLINSGLFGPNPEQPGHQHHPPKLSLYIKYGRIHLEKQLPPPTAPSSHVPE
jgi:hypothetical protein